jgi:hypothetical protein
MYNFTITCVDTDSLTICKTDMSSFSETEINNLTKELNDLFPELIKWDLEPPIEKMIVLKAKNYLLWDGKKAKIKGSALKSSTKSAALKEFLNEVLDSIITEKYNYKEIYDKYIKEVCNVKDMSRWAGKKTYTERVEESERTNEAKIREALKGSEYAGGDKFYVYYKSDDTLCLVENFDGDYNKERLLKQVWDTAMSFETIIPPETFPKYHLKKNKQILQDLLNG